MSPPLSSLLTPNNNTTEGGAPSQASNISTAPVATSGVSPIIRQGMMINTNNPMTSMLLMVDQLLHSTQASSDNPHPQSPNSDLQDNHKSVLDYKESTYNPYPSNKSNNSSYKSNNNNINSPSYSYNNNKERMYKLMLIKSPHNYNNYKHFNNDYKCTTSTNN